MKKPVLLLWLLTTAVCLTACGSKNFDMTFEEALEIANHSELQDILAGNDNFEQNFVIAGKYDADWNKVDANISSASKQSLTTKNSESSTKFGANITAEWETIKVDWSLDAKLVDDAVYLNLTSLNLTWSEDLAMIEMMVAGFKNQWFTIPMSGLSDMPNTFSILKDSKDINAKVKDIVKNEWFMVYSWKFTQFEWYNAWKFSLDNEKLNALIKEYYDSLNNSLWEESIQEIPELNIKNFEWYLVITWKDKVATVIENMEMQDEDIIMSANWFAGEDFELYLSEGEENLISVVAHKKGWKYEVSANLSETVLLNWTISAKLSKSSIDLTFDANLTVKAETEGEADIVVPFNGSWKYKSISEFTTAVPENAQDLTELLWSYLGMMWWDDYDYDYDLDEDYEGLYDDEIEDVAVETEDNTEVVEENTEVAE